MCLGIPARVISVNLSGEASRPAVLKRIDGTEMKADLAMVPEAVPGDYVVTHSGFAVSLLTEAEARRAISLFEEMKEGDIDTTENARTRKRSRE
jgi:hydrogenase expression/formation protein HypC